MRTDKGNHLFERGVRMKLFIVKASAGKDYYSERVEVLDGMEEKPKTYVGQGKKINKDKIGKIEAGIFYGSFNMVLTDEVLIQDAREKLKERVYQYNLKEYTKYQDTLNAIKNHSIDTDIDFR